MLRSGTSVYTCYGPGIIAHVGSKGKNRVYTVTLADEQQVTLEKRSLVVLAPCSRVGMRPVYIREGCAYILKWRNPVPRELLLQAFAQEVEPGNYHLYRALYFKEELIGPLFAQIKNPNVAATDTVLELHEAYFNHKFLNLC